MSSNMLESVAMASVDLLPVRGFSAQWTCVIEMYDGLVSWTCVMVRLDGHMALLPQLISLFNRPKLVDLFFLFFFL